ncbi:glycosyltransferase family A protein [Flavobacterium sp. IB48]|uniref:glycosyltransferase family 2 protein n=1 Tax=Flavobacterium sp. IB48 TaxID=2779375 RepID=UPI0018E70C8C|nr:glycosyltransferase family A protein [Flavobacterium sp. IB48]MBJ2126444.1 glycosyltransferase family 2 protein [Flavobacterium sp. IB48]
MNKEKGLVSVIIPSYNYARFITETIRSLQSSFYQKWEAIVIDDCSSDETKTVVESLMKDESRLIYERHDINKGLPATRNTGLKKAKGEFLLFLDADDIISPEKMNLHLEHFTNTPDIQISYSKCFFFLDGNTNKRYLSRKLNNNGTVFTLNGGLKKMFPIFLNDNRITVLAPIVRSSLIEKVGFFNENLKQKEDWNFWMRCILEDAKFQYLDDDRAYGLIRVHGRSLLDNETESLSYSDEFYRVLKKILYENPVKYDSEIKQYEFFMKKRKVREFIKMSLKKLKLISVARKILRK